MKGKTRAGRQIYGAIGIVVVAVFVYVARDISPYIRVPGEAALSSRWEGSGITVELAGDQDHGGIYFLPHGATIRNLFSEAGVNDTPGFKETVLAGVLHSGDRIACDTTRYRVTIGDISASARLALGMTIDLNTATVEELVLIPGIGRITAAKIVRFREKMGDFSEVDILKQIEGLGEKKYNRIKGYLSINKASCS